MAAGFSSIMKLTDLDDFISPSQECIKPIMTIPASTAPVRGLIQMDQDTGAPTTSALQVATISLSDCLACSGCVTSAEVVLVTQQSTKQLRSVLEEGSHSVVVSMAPQAVVSIANSRSLQPQQCAMALAGYFRSLGCDAVWDTNLARSLSLIEVATEVADKWKKHQADQQTPPGDSKDDVKTTKKQSNSPFPILSSACPGWVCYAEKTQPESVLQHISLTRSPQQIMGQLVRSVWAKVNSTKPVYHVTLMPCYDKKLEASRREFEDELTATKDVDCVITPVELEEMLTADNVELSRVEPMELSPLLSSGQMTSHSGSSSGGYADFVMKYLASTVYNTELTDISWTTLRNADLQEAVLSIEGREVGKVCRAYGFRNLQNIVQKFKRGKCSYIYVEVMACPGGCLNGGAQSRSSSGESLASNKQQLAQLQVLYASLPQTDPRDDTVALQLHSQMYQALDKHFAQTSYKAIEKSTTALGIKW